ncbi:LEPR-XLL domain-containing protein [Ramlibacter montanisoli]|uniref:LEPR-XLL domain-containing protein n=1 Tax=Ramlibacter montanisoli TaxID=2732512 RepID=UPI0028167435|nr:LEPR-XLL domain-containing protein [Ramlibacter montanisoli]
MFETFEPRVLLAADTVVPRVEGSIDVPGEVDRYVFSVQDEIRVVFDSLTADSSLQWSLEGQAGSIASAIPLRSADAIDRGGAVAYDLPPGDYTLSIDGTGDRTGSYAFRILDLGRAATVTPGTSVSGQLGPANETDAYNFVGTAGQTYFFDRTQQGGDTWWRLIGPDGRSVWGPTSMTSDVENVTLAQTGLYSLLVEGRVTTTTARTMPSRSTRWSTRPSPWFWARARRWRRPGRTAAAWYSTARTGCRRPTRPGCTHRAW